ncbi:hypothetical protein An02g06185 [Aspergillus niger]|uniref:Uncharacterized protein n=2 Tax=Aspergillus niger TaxID=5061 RepID=A2QD85_ASPNC|nr:hypothetical protein An02g06185 [Aspergillus niger]CAK37667.1 hypothetical protein An02g06185 [Aspergillus niger]
MLCPGLTAIVKYPAPCDLVQQRLPGATHQKPTQFHERILRIVLVQGT